MEDDRKPHAPKLYLSGLKLHDFRNYSSASLAFAPHHAVFTGENGAGKTNILEAVSLLSPGRGLRRGNYADMVRAGAANGFAVHADLQTPDGEVSLGTGNGAEGGGLEASRKLRVNGAPAKGADAFLDYLRVVWITPQMDGLFTGPSADRRRFIDRLVLAIDPAHGARVLDYEKSMRARNRLFEEGRQDAGWFEAIEAQMAGLGVAIGAARVEIVNLLNGLMEHLPGQSPFPRADLRLEGALEEQLASMTAVDLEERYRASLRDNRSIDRHAGRTLEGPHRSDLLVRHSPKQMDAALSSTGEQKALLIGVILSHARLVAKLTHMPPILLLDEVAAHLDKGRREALFTIIDDIGAQAFMTGTDRGLFDGLEGRGMFFTVTHGLVNLDESA
jgi:DNA replication and repair protein RecF